MHESVHEQVIDRLADLYRRVPIGEPWVDGVLMGPLISEGAVATMFAAVEAARKQGGEIVHGGHRLDRAGFFVEPTLIKANPGMAIVAEETFAPILYVMSYRHLDEAVRDSERCRTRADFSHLHERRARGRGIPVARRIRLRHRQREYRHLGRRDWWCLRRRKSQRRRPRSRIRRLESLHAQTNLHDQLRPGAAAGSGREIRHLSRPRPDACGRLSRRKRQPRPGALPD